MLTSLNFEARLKNKLLSTVRLDIWDTLLLTVLSPPARGSVIISQVSNQKLIALRRVSLGFVILLTP